MTLEGRALENTITEQDLDASSRVFVHSLRGEDIAVENDLDVDGLSESLLSRLISLLSSFTR